MPENLLKTRVESQLLESVRSVRDRRNAGTRSQDEYRGALKHLNEFVIEGIWPDYLKPKRVLAVYGSSGSVGAADRPAPSEAPKARFRK
jgi:hypothetical protein